MYYIVSVNKVAANEYSVSAIRTKIVKLTEAQSLLSVQKSNTENPESAAAFAKNQNMIEVKDAVYVFENNDVALQK